MKNIKIKQLKLQNFKCHGALTLDFNGRNAGIFGDNATGKTSVYDALTWLLFGKDSKGNGEKNIEIKPIGDDGMVIDHNAETEVEAVLMVDDGVIGGEVSLRRTLKEIWTTKRGSTEATYDGNTSEYYIDGVPVKKYAFTEKVGELVDEDTFKMLTSVSHFADVISWQERREVLFRVAGVMSDEQIMATDERFLQLIEAKGKLSIEDHKKKLLAEKRGFVSSKSEIPARISECQRTIEDVSGLDFAEARLAIEQLSAKREALGADVLRIENDSASSAKRIEIREARVELDALENENKAYRASQTANEPNVAAMKNRIGSMETELSTKEKMLASFMTLVANYDTDIAASRERWIATNRESFSGGVCYACGQALPAAQLKSAQESFESNKAARLREIEATATANKKARAQYEVRIAELTEEIESLRGVISSSKAEAEAALLSRVEPVDMPTYSVKREEILGRIRTLEGELADIVTNASAVKGDILRQIAELNVEISKHNEVVSRESLLEYSKRRIEELSEDAKNASACLDAIEGMLFLIDEYSRYKTKFVEDSINGMFRVARFRLFREQANGGIEDRCDVVMDGVPYINVNSGARINLGIDIINTLSRAYGVSVPLFVDNAESVTKLENTNTQIIRLVVSENDKKLRCEYEN